MRIAIFSETYLPDINGVATHIKLLKEGLENLGHEVLVVTADAKSRRHYTQGDVLHCPAIAAKKIYNYGLASPLSFKRLRILRKFNPDIIHIHQEFGVGLSGALIAKVLRKPLVYTLHTMYDDYIYYVAPQPIVPIVRNISHGYFKLLAKNATALTGPSEKVAEYFRKVGVKTPVNVIPNPVELDIFRPDAIDQEKKHAFRERYQIPEDATVACFCGRLGKEKSLDTALDYWAKTVSPEDNLRYVIIGDGPDRDELKEQAKRLGIADQIIFTGKVPHDEVPPYYAGCDVYLTASLTEMHSISMLEAMATGLPVLTIYDPLNASQITEGVNGYIFRTPEEMHQLLTKFHAMPREEFEAFRKGVRDSVEQSGAEDLAQYLLDIYAGVYKKRA